MAREHRLPAGRRGSRRPRRRHGRGADPCRSRALRDGEAGRQPRHRACPRALPRGRQPRGRDLCRLGRSPRAGGSRVAADQVAPDRSDPLDGGGHGAGRAARRRTVGADAPAARGPGATGLVRGPVAARHLVRQPGALRRARPRRAGPHRLGRGAPALPRPRPGARHADADPLPATARTAYDITWPWSPGTTSPSPPRSPRSTSRRGRATFTRRPPAGPLRGARGQQSRSVRPPRSLGRSPR